MIELQHVSKKYLLKKALDDIDVSFPIGKIIGVIGENGSGKSTMLKLIAGLLQPTNGEVLIDEKHADRKISTKVAYMSDIDQFYPFFTVNQLVDFYESQFQDFHREKARDILRLMHIEGDEKIKHLSKGNRGRVKMAVTLARNAPYILLDEPFSGLDPMVRTSIVQGMIQYIDLQSQTLIITTHEINEIEALLDEVIVLRKGKILGQQSTEDIRMEYQISVVDWMKQLYEGRTKYE
ncbi:ABC-2 type transport system ATP-binding protein [Thalassobacillus cyri]|uniref:ABC-2 type transport system ATP-binding protein n=1 Tax=Thalassobacillus cyri TaxID=571932 RepID=A0A1H4G5X3_9BACI|nr:ABC transporter ATP-binding protein [Thalassobacillus cyri]SEB04440.1 ABC-2 type transport system ATP-binding protein [Thalassobacillus cyri]